MVTFLANKYTKWYMNIISQAKLNVNLRSKGYFEKHHIIPKCLDGPNHHDNLVKLTTKEHFICHRLLTKMTTGDAKRRMSYAMHRTIQRAKTNLDNFRFTANTYTKIRLDVVKALSLTHKGKSKSPEQIQKMIISSANYWNSNDPKVMSRREAIKQQARDRMTGRDISQDERDRIASSVSNYVKQTIWINDGTINQRILATDQQPDGWNRGRIMSQDLRDKLYIKDRILITDGVNTKKILSTDPIPEGWKRGRFMSQEYKDKLIQNFKGHHRSKKLKP